jgi:hypothetical protein
MADTQLWPKVTVTASGPTHAPIENFLRSFSNDIARPNRFDVRIILPNSIIDNLNIKNNSTSGIVRTLALRCEATELPGRTFGTVDQKFGSNPTTKFPIHSSYNDLSMTFIVSDTMIERTIFDVWMEYINPTTSFDFDYKKNTVSDIAVIQYDLQDTPVYTVNFYNAYPIVVNQMDLDWSNDGYHKLTVVFAYDYWQNQGIEKLGEILTPQNQLAFNSYTETIQAKAFFTPTS